MPTATATAAPSTATVTIASPKAVPGQGRGPVAGARASIAASGDEVRAGTLVQAARAGDANAWRALVDRYSPMLWNIARGFRLDHATCADVVQTTWVALAENLESVREPDAVGGWLAQTARRACLREVCRRKRIDLWGEFSERDMVDPAPAPDEW